MRKLLSMGVLVLGLIAFSSTNVTAQPSFKVGGGLAYGTEAEAIGINGGAVLGFTDKIRAGADVTIFFPDGFDWWEINGNLHYMLLSKANTSVYGLAGLNIATISLDANLGQFGSFSADATEAGLNLGGGAEFGVGFGTVFTEVKYVVSDLDQLALTGGLRFGI